MLVGWMSLKHWKVLVVFNDVFFGEEIGSCSTGFGKKIGPETLILMEIEVFLLQAIGVVN